MLKTKVILYSIACCTSYATAYSATFTSKNAAQTAESKIEQRAISSLEHDIRGLGFSAGIAAVFMQGDPAVETAVIDSEGFVRVTEKSDVRLGGILEAHYLFGDARFNKTETRIRDAISVTEPSAGTYAVSLEDNGAVRPGTVLNDFAWGITIVTELGTDVFQSLGVGPIFSFRRFDIEDDGTLTPRSAAFNVGIVALVEPEVNHLADGIDAGKALPDGESLRFEKEAEFGFAITFSAGF